MNIKQPSNEPKSTGLTMADLLAGEEFKPVSIMRGQEVEGEVVNILPQEIILDLGAKAEGVLSQRDLSPEQAANLKIGDKLLARVIQTESDSGQVILGLQKALGKMGGNNRWKRFEAARERAEELRGKGIEVNRGGLIVEVDGIRGFLPSSQVALSQASNLEDLVGQEITVTVIEVDPAQNRLIFSQKTKLSEDTRKQLGKLKAGEKAEGLVAAILPFGIFLTLENGVEGLVHVSEISWEKVDSPQSLFKMGEKIEAKVISVDANTGRVNLSIKQLSTDPFEEKAGNFQPDDIVDGVVSKVAPAGVFITLDGGIEGFIPNAKLKAETVYEAGQKLNCLVDSVDTQKRRINLVPFITTTKGLIYK